MSDRDDAFAIYRMPQWFESLSWQHMWIDLMVGWWVGEFGKPKTVCDFGAGDGWWCKRFKDIGVQTAYAVELDDVARQFISPSVYFLQHDLREPLEVEARFDLTICLEVAEHLDRQDGATLAETLVGATGNLLLFSAARPGQGGTEHINPQEPDYWIKQIERKGKIAYSELRTEKTRKAFANINNECYEFLAGNVLVFARV